MTRDLTFEALWRGDGAKPRTSVNAGYGVRTSAQTCPDTILKRALGLRAMFEVGERILIQKMDVKNAFSQVGVDPDGTSHFTYRLGTFRFHRFLPSVQFG